MNWSCKLTLWERERDAGGGNLGLSLRPRKVREVTKIYGNPKNKNAIHICPQILNSRGICYCLMNVLLWTTACLPCNSSWSCDLVLQFSCSVVSDSLQSHGLQHTRPPCPSPTPGVHSNSRPLSQWCHPTISSSVVPFSRLQSFPASVSFRWVGSLSDSWLNLRFLHCRWILYHLSHQGSLPLSNFT